MKILAAGRTSAERAALSIARELELSIEGRGPKNQTHLQSIKHNVRDADGTLGLTWSGPPHSRSPVINAILRSPKPSMGVAVRHQGNVASVREWILRHKIKALHVTGHVPFTASKQFLRKVLNNGAVA